MQCQHTSEPWAFSCERACAEFCPFRKRPFSYLVNLGRREGEGGRLHIWHLPAGRPLSRVFRERAENLQRLGYDKHVVGWALLGPGGSAGGDLFIQRAEPER